MSSSEPRHRPTTDDVFRPRLPLDPFAPAADPLHPPSDDAQLIMNPDTPWIAHDLAGLTRAFSQSPNVLLVLGSQSPHAVAPLLRSQTFAQSLVLFVTHSPPTRSALVAATGSASSHAAIRVLRLSEPLAPGAPAFALALVAVLEAAAAVARSWRAQVVAAPPLPDSGPDMAQLAQAADGSFSIIEQLTDVGVPSPPLSNEHIHPPTSTNRRSKLSPVNNSPYPAGRTRPPSALSVASTTSNSGRSGFFFSSSTSLNHKSSANRLSTQPNSKRLSTSSKRLSSSAPNPNDGTRAFDALISFLPAAQLEKAVLKHVVLVSTLAGSFLSGPSFGLFASPNASATTSYSYFGSLPGSRRGSVSSGIGMNNSGSTSRTESIINSAPDTERPSSPSRSFMSMFTSPPPVAPQIHMSRSVPGSPRGSLYHEYGGANTAFYQRTNAHIIHILPASYRSAKLTGALGAFLASYSPAVSPPMGARSPMKPQAYVVAERAVSSAGALECLLVGALEAEPPLSLSVSDAKGKRREEGVRMGRWVAGVVVPREEPEHEGDSGSGEDEIDVDVGTTKGSKTAYGLPTPPASRSGSGEDEGESQVNNGPGPAAVSKNGHTRTPSASTPAPKNGHGRTPSTSLPKGAMQPSPPLANRPSRPSAAAPAPVFPVVEPTLLRSPSGRRRVDSAPSATAQSHSRDLGHGAGAGTKGKAKATLAPPQLQPISTSTLRPQADNRSRTWGQRGSRFFGGKTADDFRLASPPSASASSMGRGHGYGQDGRGRSSPDLRELSGGGGGGGGKRRTRRWWAFWS
ncbi:hypothetical protein C8F01DRAFT_1141602 [Mycena amicta]|nr:hypothetical protein C8F01DRAFT_1141602 [Mycena amicta]